MRNRMFLAAAILFIRAIDAAPHLDKIPPGIHRMADGSLMGNKEMDAWNENQRKNDIVPERSETSRRMDIPLPSLIAAASPMLAHMMGTHVFAPAPPPGPEGECFACKNGAVDPELNKYNFPTRRVSETEAAITNDCDFHKDGKGVTKINGEVPGPGTKMQELTGGTTMIDTITSGGLRLIIMIGVRKAKTRVPIHKHNFGGWTCVLSGEIVDYLEGIKPDPKFPKGSCYYMPPNVYMTAANLGDTDAVLIDTFLVPLGKPYITFHEPGAYGCATDGKPIRSHMPSGVLAWEPKKKLAELVCSIHEQPVP